MTCEYNKLNHSIYFFQKHIITQLIQIIDVSNKLLVSFLANLKLYFASTKMEKQID
jgi:hypothetical protein